MPVYVTRAHVTIGDSNRKHSKKSGPNKRPFYFRDTCKTPYCCRTILVIFFGLAMVCGGVVMTIIGYKPALLLPGYTSINNTTRNASEPTAIPRLLGEPGPLRIMVYIGPVLMGIGVFGVMMAIVLFCEIKDRYLLNILPSKEQERKMQKDMLYDIIIEEFRKNYFRGIEVPLKKPERKKSKRFSFSLSGSGNSLISFARRHSHDFLVWARKKRNAKSADKEDEKWKNATFPKRNTSDSWMKTSSLPNIKHKSDAVELEDIFNAKQSADIKCNATVQSKIPTLPDNKPKEAKIAGVDNPAYRDSPLEKKAKARVSKYVTENQDENIKLTTVLVHNVSLNNENTKTNISQSNHKTESKLEGTCVGENFIKTKTDVDCLINKTQNITTFPNAEDHIRTIPNAQKNIVDLNPVVNRDNKCKCKTEEFCSEHALGMESDASSLTLSWEGVPCEWNDARRNTEPCNIFHSRLREELDSGSSSSRSLVCDDNSQALTQETNSSTTHSEKIREVKMLNKHSPGPFRTYIRIFHSESNLSRPYSLLRQYQDDTLSLDSLELTDDMLKNFEMAEMAYI